MGIRAWVDDNGWRWLWDGKQMWVESQDMDWKASREWKDAKELIEDRVGRLKKGFREVSSDRALKFMAMKDACVGV